MFSAMIRVYENYTREISLLPREHKSFRQASQAVSGLRPNLANQSKETGAETQTFLNSPSPESIGGICSYGFLGTSTTHQCCRRVVSSARRNETRRSRYSLSLIASRSLRASWRWFVFQIQTDGLGDVCYGGKTGQISSSILPRSRITRRQGRLWTMARGFGDNTARDQEAC